MDQLQQAASRRCAVINSKEATDPPMRLSFFSSSIIIILQTFFTCSPWNEHNCFLFHVATLQQLTATHTITSISGGGTFFMNPRMRLPNAKTSYTLTPPLRPYGFQCYTAICYLSRCINMVQPIGNQETLLYKHDVKIPFHHVIPNHSSAFFPLSLNFLLWTSSNFLFFVFSIQ